MGRAGGGGGGDTRVSLYNSPILNLRGGHLKGSNPNANLPPGKLILAKMACPGREKGMGQTSWMTQTHGNRAKMACAVHWPTSRGPRCHAFAVERCLGAIFAWWGGGRYALENTQCVTLDSSLRFPGPPLTSFVWTYQDVTLRASLRNLSIFRPHSVRFFTRALCEMSVVATTWAWIGLLLCVVLKAGAPIANGGTVVAPIPESNGQPVAFQVPTPPRYIRPANPSFCKPRISPTLMSALTQIDESSMGAGGASPDCEGGFVSPEIPGLSSALCFPALSALPQWMPLGSLATSPPAWQSEFHSERNVLLPQVKLTTLHFPLAAHKNSAQHLF